jgi:hypothetical protein
MLLTAQTYIKANALTILTLPNIGIETSIGEKSTLQVDVLASFWKSVKANLGNFTSRLNIDTISKKSIMAFMQVHTLGKYL